MRSSVLAWATALLAGTAFAADSWAQPRDAFCLCDSDADVIANDFAQLISNFSTDFANNVLADDYTDQSDSVNTLIDSGTTSPIAVWFLPSYDTRLLSSRLIVLSLARYLDLCHQGCFHRWPKWSARRSFHYPSDMAHLRHRHHPMGCHPGGHSAGSRFRCFDRRAIVQRIPAIPDQDHLWRVQQRCLVGRSRPPRVHLELDLKGIDATISRQAALS